MIKLRANISVIIFTLSITLLLLLGWNIKSEPSDKCTYLLEDIQNTLDRFNSIEGTDVALKHLIDDLRADLEYSKLCRRPKLFERFAPQGIPVPLVYITNQGFNVHPINALNLATEALLYRGDWKEFHEIMDWMLRYLERKGNSSFFNFYFAWERASIPWNSSISQGIGAGYYAIAYKKFGDPRYLDAARSLVNSFLLDLDNGGFALDTKYGRFYLEYSNAPDDLVLNGFMLSLKGLTIYHSLIGDNTSKKVLDEGLSTLRKMLPDYDNGEWSLYSTKHGRADEIYHRLHIRLLYFLGKWHNDDYLLLYAKKWDYYLTRVAKSEIPRAEQEYKFWAKIVEELRG